MVWFAPHVWVPLCLCPTVSVFHWVLCSTKSMFYCVFVPSWQPLSMPKVTVTQVWTWWPMLRSQVTVTRIGSWWPMLSHSDLNWMSHHSNLNWVMVTDVKTTGHDDSNLVMVCVFRLRDGVGIITLDCLVSFAKCQRKLLSISYLEHKTNDWVRSKSNFLVGPQEPPLATIKETETCIVWGYATRHDSPSKTILHGTLEGERHCGQQRKIGRGSLLNHPSCPIYDPVG